MSGTQTGPATVRGPRDLRWAVGHEAAALLVELQTQAALHHRAIGELIRARDAMGARMPPSGWWARVVWLVRG
jgi:hypothetical protein